MSTSTTSLRHSSIHELIAARRQARLAATKIENEKRNPLSRISSVRDQNLTSNSRKSPGYRYSESDQESLYSRDSSDASSRLYPIKKSSSILSCSSSDSDSDTLSEQGDTNHGAHLPSEPVSTEKNETTPSFKAKVNRILKNLKKRITLPHIDRKTRIVFWKTAAIFTALALTGVAVGVAAASITATPFFGLGVVTLPTAVIVDTYLLSMSKSMLTGLWKGGFSGIEVDSWQKYKAAVINGVRLGSDLSRYTSPLASALKKGDIGGAVNKTIGAGIKHQKDIKKRTPVIVDGASKKEDKLASDEKVRYDNDVLARFKYNQSNYISQSDEILNNPDAHKQKLKACEAALYEIANLNDIDKDYKELMIAEILSKRVAFIDFNVIKTPEIKIPVYNSTQDKFEIYTYQVENIIPEEKAIPCWGLTHKKGTSLSLPHAPIILWRGTAPNISARGGALSVANNLDPKGPARSFFDSVKQSLSDWLVENASPPLPQARVIGYSQGAALACYTSLEFSSYISHDENSPSFAWCAPGISKVDYKNWTEINETEKPNLKTILTIGDPISLTGSAIMGKNVYAIRTASYDDDDTLDIKYHTEMISTRKDGFHIYEADVEEENAKECRALNEWVSKYLACIPSQELFAPAAKAQNQFLDFQAQNSATT